VRRIRPPRIAPQNQRHDLLAFAGVLDAKLAGIAPVNVIAEPFMREACVLHRLPSTKPPFGRDRTDFERRPAADPIRCSVPSTGRGWPRFQQRSRWGGLLRTYLGSLHHAETITASRLQTDTSGSIETAVPALRYEGRIRCDADQGLAEVLAAKHLGESGGNDLKSLADILAVTDLARRDPGCHLAQEHVVPVRRILADGQVRTRTPLASARWRSCALTSTPGASP
jgi:hypothetical protein